MFVRKKKYEKLAISKSMVDMERDFYRGAYKGSKIMSEKIIQGCLAALEIMREEMILNCEETVKFELENAFK